MKKAGNIISFTLVELLIVIAIIAILASLLFPSLKKGMDKVRAISCTSNMKQLGMVFNQYSVDFDGRMPIHKITATSLAWSNYTRELFTLGYLKESDTSKHYTAAIAICPVNLLLLEVSQGVIASRRNGTYNYNAYYTANNDFTQPVFLSKMQKPSACAMFDDGSNGSNFMHYAGINYPHAGKTNLLFFDMHAEGKKNAEIPSSTSNVFWKGRD